MANLFFVHTPLELLIAQQIINQEKLTDNVMLCGYVGGNKHFLDIYRLTIISSMWMERVLMPDVAGWAAIEKRHLLKTALRAFRRYKEICSLLKVYRIDTLFLGDMNNFSCKFGSKLFKKKGYRIVFFEEGSSHYNFHIHPRKGGYLLNKLLAIFFDCFYYLPIYHFRFATYCFMKDLPFSELPIDLRYSVVPYYHEDFDKQIRIERLFSNDLIQFLDSEVSKFSDIESSILFMSQNIYESLGNLNLYLQVVEGYFSTLDNTSILFIKFHPREQEEERKAVIRIAEKYHLAFHILSAQMNIPVEYYLQYMKFKEIMTFFSSTAMYNGYLFPEMKFTFLLRPFYDLCKICNEKNISQLENLLSLLDSCQNKQKQND
jgi:hypothetical protein